jgi:hypothetical protein
MVSAAENLIRILFNTGIMGSIWEKDIYGFEEKLNMLED